MLLNEHAVLRSDFPLLNSRNVVYLDNGATSQKPLCVINAESAYYERHNANPLRGLYELSMDATNDYEDARREVASFIGAARPEEIIFTRNATESLNLVSYSYGSSHVAEGDEIIVSISEHHSNLLPWQRLAREKHAKLVWFECDAEGYYDPQRLEALVSERTKIVAIAQMSNIFGRINDIRAFADIAHRAGAVLVCDGAQSVPHIPVDVRDLDVDFLAFSGHKMYAPMGIGVLYARYELLEEMPPFLYGGEMIEYVTRDSATYAEIPHKFEAGTVNVGGAVGLAEAVRYIRRIGFETIEKREGALCERAMEGMKRIPHVHVIGAPDAKDHHGILTFTIDGVHPHDVAAIFDSANIAVRAGHHCAQPLHQYLRTLLPTLEVLSTTRASIGLYNTPEDIDAFLDCLSGIRGAMGYTD